MLRWLEGRFKLLKPEGMQSFPNTDTGEIKTLRRNWYKAAIADKINETMSGNGANLGGARDFDIRFCV